MADERGRVLMAHAASVSQGSEPSETRTLWRRTWRDVPGRIEDNNCQNKAPLSALSSTSTSGGINYGVGVGAVIDQIRLAMPMKTPGGGVLGDKAEQKFTANIRRQIPNAPPTPRAPFIPLLPSLPDTLFEIKPP